MLFSSTVFIYLFLPIVLFFYYVVFRKHRAAQNVFLLLASLFFYAWGEPKFVLVMILSIVVNWLFGFLVEKAKRRDKKGLKRLSIVLTCVFNLGILFVFKYLSFAMRSVYDVFSINSAVPSIALPIGISFFTFQAMSYVIDVYRGKGSVQKNVLNVGLYISFFPQLIAGPIVRYETIADEIKNRKENLKDFSDGFTRFIIGLAKKVLLANTFAIVSDAAFGAEASGISVAFSWLGAVSYTLQIFFDFSGYSDMAIGLGKMFGFHFLENFNYPYISRSVSEFWRRWHMSLGTWFRDYLYIPLGGSRVRKPRMMLNLFIVWLLTGLWHGANWTFVVWGLMYFVLLSIEKLTGLDKKAVKNKAVSVIKWIYTLFFVIIGWVIFRADNLGAAVSYVGSMFGLTGNAGVDGLFTAYFTQNIVLLAFGILFSTPIAKFIGKKAKRNVALDVIYIILVVALFALSVSSLVSSSYNPFIYFNF